MHEYVPVLSRLSPHSSRMDDVYRRSSCATSVVYNPIKVLSLVSTFPLYLHSMSVCSISLSPTQTKYAVCPESTMDLLTGIIKSSVGSDEKSNNKIIKF